VAGRCNASQDAQDAWDAENTSLASGRNADGSDAGSVFADEPSDTAPKTPLLARECLEYGRKRLHPRFFFSSQGDMRGCQT